MEAVEGLVTRQMPTILFARERNYWINGIGDTPERIVPSQCEWTDSVVVPSAHLICSYRRHPPSTTNTALAGRWNGTRLGVNAFAEGEYRHTLHNSIEGVAVGLDRLGEEQHRIGIVVVASRTGQPAKSRRFRNARHGAGDGTRPL